MFKHIAQYIERQQLHPKRPCEHWYPPDTWMLINGYKVCSGCFTDWKLGQFSKTGSIQFQSHPHR